MDLEKIGGNVTSCVDKMINNKRQELSTMDNSTIDVSVVIPVHNADPWLDECLESVWHQELEDICLEVSLFLDSCTDHSQDIAYKWIGPFKNSGIKVVINVENNGVPKGVGYAKNKAVQQSAGKFLCFMDADDVMKPDRVRVQYKLLQQNTNTLIGSGFTRIPVASTRRYTAWANNLSPSQLHTQVYTSHGPTVIMPTWFCRRQLFDSIGSFSEAGRGEPEDLLFFYKHLRLGGKVLRAPGDLLQYRYHDKAATLSVTESRIWDLRVEELTSQVLVHWDSFTIWNGGRQGRRLYRSLPQAYRDKVVCFCDVDPNKIGRVYTYEESELQPRPTVPIVHFREAGPPFVICVKLDLTGGKFEENLKSLNLTEGEHYYHFN